MAAQGHTRTELRQEVARVFGYLLYTQSAVGNPDISSSTHVHETRTAIYADDYWIGSYVYVPLKVVLDNSDYNWEGRVTDFDSATGTLTFAPAWTDAYTANPTPWVEIYRFVSPNEVNHALGQVCAGTVAIENLTPSSTSVGYDLSSYTALNHPEQVQAVYVWQNSDHLVPPQEIRGWRVYDDQGVLTLILPYTLVSTNELSLVYARDGDPFTADTTKVNLPLSLVRARAVVYLIENILSPQDSQGMQRWGTLLREWKTKLVLEERKYQRAGYKVRRFRWSNTTPGDSWLSAFGLSERYE